jgi:8-oxo-dGTP pyrophosphatase MutT (NUDIX family)
MSAAGVMLFRHDGAVLLARRSSGVTEPGTWGIPGGRLRAREDPATGAYREFVEEMGPMPLTRLLDAYDVDIPGGHYTTLVVEAVDTRGWRPQLNWEHDTWGWFHRGNLPTPLHPGVELVLNAHGG